MLQENAARVIRERSSRREPLTDPEARELVRNARRVIVARGRKVVEIDPDKVRLDDLKGPSGNYRAPMILTGRTLLVGFNLEALGRLV